MGGNFFTGTMPNHTAIDTDAPPGTNLIDLQRDGGDENPTVDKFSSPSAILFTILVSAVTFFLTVFLAVTYFASVTYSKEQRSKSRIQIHRRLKPREEDNTLVPSL